MKTSKKKPAAKRRNRTVIKARRVTVLSANPALTDQEILVLKAATHTNSQFPTGGAASIREVLKAVGLPHHRTKAIIYGLAEKGVIALARHTAPAHLTNDERKHMIYKPGRKGEPANYYLGFFMRDQSGAAYRDRVEKNPSRRRRNKAGAISMADISKFPPSVQAQIRAQLGTIEKQEAKAETPAQRKKVELKRRGLFSRLRTRLNVLRKAKKFKVSARDTARCPRRTIKVRALTADNALSHAKRKLGSRYDQLKVQNGTGKRRRTNGAIEKAGKFVEKTARRTIKASGKILTGVGKVLSNPRLTGPEETLIAAMLKLKPRGALVSIQDLIQALSFSPSTTKKLLLTLAKKGVIALHHHDFAASLSRAERKLMPSVPDEKSWNKRMYFVGAALRNPAQRRNDGADARREQFAGTVTSHKDLFFPEGAPQGLSTLGPLVLIRTDAGDVAPVKGGAYLCQDARGHLFIGATRNTPLWSGQAGSLGKVSRVEYECKKPHLGEPKTVTWYHDFESPLPELRADGKGGLRFVGGGYTIKREGIVG